MPGNALSPLPASWLQGSNETTLAVAMSSPSIPLPGLRALQGYVCSLPVANTPHTHPLHVCVHMCLCMCVPACICVCSHMCTHTAIEVWLVHPAFSPFFPTLSSVTCLACQEDISGGHRVELPWSPIDMLHRELCMGAGKPYPTPRHPGTLAMGLSYTDSH